ncbi:MAG: regulatory protein GemA [Gammaproteobacteria bacterium]|nr:regulatory protein GemA [Gammaproteobacteria bacterium]
MSLPDPNTARLRKAIFAACRRSGFDEELRHQVQLRVTGKRSITEMDANDMRKLLAHLNGARKKGEAGLEWMYGPGSTPPPPEPAPLPDPRPDLLPESPLTGKLRALWRSAYWLGVVRDQGDAALASWICRQTGYGAAKWITPKDADRLVEALKGWMERDGGVDWSPHPRPVGRPKRIPAARIMEALWRKLHEAGEVGNPHTTYLREWVFRTRQAPGDYTDLHLNVQNQLVRELGRWYRRTAKE